MIVYQYIISYMLLFAIGGVCGWVLEFFFRRIVHKQWVNPGFLNGPLLPLYGFGVIILYAIADINIESYWKILLYLVLLTLLEYIAGIIFIKGMGLKLWDYSKRWGNIQGIICPLFSAAWCAVGALFLFFLYEPLKQVFSWSMANIDFSFFLGLLYGILVIDMCISFNVSLHLREFAKKAKEVISYEQIKNYIMVKNKESKAKLRFVLPFKTKDFTKTLENYMSELKERASKLKEEKKKK